MPLWCFHSADDVVFSVANSDRLVTTLRRAGGDAVRYTRFERDPVSKRNKAASPRASLSAAARPRRGQPQPASASLGQSAGIAALGRGR